MQNRSKKDTSDKGKDPVSEHPRAVYKRLLKRAPREKGYRATYVDGIGFHSAKEAERYKQLCLLEKAGEIEVLELQVAYPLVVNGEHITTYKADFVYYDRKQGRQVIEDAKGHRTERYQFKKKLFEAINKPVKIFET